MEGGVNPRGVMENFAEEMSMIGLTFSVVSMCVTMLNPGEQVETGTKDVGKYVLRRNDYKKFGFNEKHNVPIAVGLVSDEVIGMPGIKGKPTSVAYKCEKEDLCGGFTERMVGMVNAFMVADILNRSLAVDMDEPCGDQPFCGLLKPADQNWDYRPRRSKGWLTVRATNDNLMEFHSTIRHLMETKDILPETIDIKSRHTYASMLSPYLSNSSWEISSDLSSLWRQASEKLFRSSLTVQGQTQRVLRTVMKDGVKRLICAQISVGRSGNNSDWIGGNVGFASSFPISRQNLWGFIRNATNSTDKTWGVFVTSDSSAALEEAREEFPAAATRLGGLAHDDSSVTRGTILLDLVASSIISKCDVVVSSEGSLFGAYSSLRAGPQTQRYVLGTKVRPACVDIYRIANPLQACYDTE